MIIGGWRRVTILLSVIAVAAVIIWSVMIRMPGKSFDGTPPPLSAGEEQLREELRSHVEKLGGEIGERNLSRYPQLVAAADYIESQLAGWKVRRDSYEIQGKSCANIEAEKPGRVPGIILVGAHYDSVFGSPGQMITGPAWLLCSLSRIDWPTRLTRKPCVWSPSSTRSPVTFKPVGWAVMFMRRVADSGTIQSKP